MRWIASLLFLCSVTTSVAQETIFAFSEVETPPRYTECRTSNKHDGILCTQKAVEAFAKQKFNTGLFKNLNLNEKRIRVYAQFIIDQNGAIKDIKIRTAHPQLEKETKRVLNLLPNFIPGKHGNELVKTRYSLPLVFVLG